jgi:hypothetical protein
VIQFLTKDKPTVWVMMFANELITDNICWVLAKSSMPSRKSSTFSDFENEN